MKGKYNIILIIFLLLCIPFALYFYIVRTSPPKPVKNDFNKQFVGPIVLNKEKELLLESLVKDHKPLVESDQKIKDQLIKNPNPILENPDYVVTYDKKNDMFQVEIRTIKISTVQNEVVQWFKDKGFSGAAVCILPIQFSIDKQSADSLEGKGVVLNPLPPGC